MDILYSSEQFSFATKTSVRFFLSTIKAEKNHKLDKITDFML